MEQLKRMGIYRETLANGFLFGEHGLFDKRVAYETRAPAHAMSRALPRGHR